MGARIQVQWALFEDGKSAQPDRRLRIPRCPVHAAIRPSKPGASLVGALAPPDPEQTGSSHQKSKVGRWIEGLPFDIRQGTRNSRLRCCLALWRDIAGSDGGVMGGSLLSLPRAFFGNGGRLFREQALRERGSRHRAGRAAKAGLEGQALGRPSGFAGFGSAKGCCWEFWRVGWLG